MLLPHVTKLYSSPQGRGTQHTFMPKYSCAQHAYTTPVHVGGPTHKRYRLMSLKRTHPHADEAPNLHLCPNTAVLSTPTPLLSMWGAHHINGTSSCRRSVLIPTRMGHPTYIRPKYGCGQNTYTTPAHVGHVSHIPISPCRPSLRHPTRTGHPTQNPIGGVCVDSRHQHPITPPNHQQIY